jgi:hypothetical protein
MPLPPGSRLAPELKAYAESDKIEFNEEGDSDSW